MAAQLSTWLDRNWFALLVALFLLGMMLDGHRRGFLRLAVSALALILTTLFARTALPVTASFLAKNTGLQTAAERYISEKTGLDTVTDRQIDDTAGQDRVIENLPIPESLKAGLRANNTATTWEALGATGFQQYAADFLGRTLLNYFGFSLLFILFRMLLHLLMRVLNLFTSLPIIHGINQIAGAVLGLAEGVFFLWFGFILLNLFQYTPLGSGILERIEATGWLTFLYQNNLLLTALGNLWQGLF